MTFCCNDPWVDGFPVDGGPRVFWIESYSFWTWCRVFWVPRMQSGLTTGQFHFPWWSHLVSHRPWRYILYLLISSTITAVFLLVYKVLTLHVAMLVDHPGKLDQHIIFCPIFRSWWIILSLHNYRFMFSLSLNCSLVLPAREESYSTDLTLTRLQLASF